MYIFPLTNDTLGCEEDCMDRSYIERRGHVGVVCPSFHDHTCISSKTVRK